VVSALASSDSVAKLGPGAVKAVKSAAPVLGGAAAAVSLAAPFAVVLTRVARDAMSAANAALPAGALALAWGLLLCFFGGQFVTLLAAMEAYNSCGGAEATAAVRTVVDSGAAVLSTAAADEAKDAGAGGAAPASVLLRRKALLLARMTSPEAVSGAAVKLWVSYCGVLAVLKLRTARRLAMSLAVSDVLAPVVSRHAMPKLDAAVSPELRKWNATALALALKAAVLLIFLLFASAADAMAAALRGGELAARTGLELLQKRGLLKASVDDKLTYAVALALAAAGVTAQAASFKVPFPVSLVTWPVGVADWAVRYYAGVGRLA
jgi:hypothetical protein